MDTWKRLQAVANLTAGDETYNHSVLWRLCLTESGFKAPNLFIMSSLVLAKPDYLRALAPEQESFMRACRSHASSCLLKIIDRFMRGQRIPKYPHCHICGEETGSEVTVWFFTTLLRGSMIHLSTYESVFDRKVQEAYQFLERYLTEAAPLIHQRPENPACRFYEPSNGPLFFKRRKQGGSIVIFILMRVISIHSEYLWQLQVYSTQGGQMTTWRWFPSPGGRVATILHFPG